VRGQAGALAEIATSERSPEREANAVAFMLGYVGELEEDLEGDGARLLTGTDCPGGYACPPAPNVRWILAARRPAAHKPTGPPRL
jgi:hypothetical protein